MSTLIRTEEVPAADRLDFVQAITATTWVPMECRSDFRADYRGEFRASGLGRVEGTGDKARLAVDPVLLAQWNRLNPTERFFNLLKHFRAIATRYDKLAKTFLAGVHLACATILLN